MQVNNKEALNAFLAQHPDGYYARLAKLQLAKIIAEAPKVATVDQAGQIDQSQTRVTVQAGAPGTASGPSAPTLTPVTGTTETTKAVEPAQAGGPGDQQIVP